MTTAPNYLLDTGVFILYFRRNQSAIHFFRETQAVFYYSRMTRKELLRPPIRAREKAEVLAFLRQFRLVNPDPRIADGFSVLLEKYSYLKDHLADALIAATAWKKNLEIITTNPRHFQPIAEICVRKFPDTFGG